MAIKNYSTTIPAAQTVGEIQGILAVHGAKKVVGEFVCDRIDTIRDEENGFVAGGVQQSEWISAAQALIQAACLTEKELKEYLGNEYGYGLHISDLKIYDKPKELGEFRKPCASCGLAYSKYLARYMGCWDMVWQEKVFLKSICFWRNTGERRQKNEID